VPTKRGEQFMFKRWHTRKRLDNAFNQGMEAGESLGRFHACEEARKAFSEGSIEFWLEKNRAKTMEEWDDWEKENGPL
jgi:predicted phosphoadenosine phosphosulfate sulfurtransferase